MSQAAKFIMNKEEKLQFTDNFWKNNLLIIQPLIKGVALINRINNQGSYIIRMSNAKRDFGCSSLMEPELQEKVKE